MLAATADALPGRPPLPIPPATVTSGARSSLLDSAGAPPAEEPSTRESAGMSASIRRAAAEASLLGGRPLPLGAAEDPTSVPSRT